MPAKLGPLGLGWKRSQQADRLMDVQIARMVKFHSILTRAMLGVPARSLVGQIQYNTMSTIFFPSFKNEISPCPPRL